MTTVSFVASNDAWVVTNLITADVPEPASLLLLAAAFAGIIAARVKPYCFGWLKRWQEARKSCQG